MSLDDLKERGFDYGIMAGLRARMEENAKAFAAPEYTKEDDEALLLEMKQGAHLFDSQEKVLRDALIKIQHLQNTVKFMQDEKRAVDNRLCVAIGRIKELEAELSKKAS